MPVEPPTASTTTCDDLTSLSTHTSAGLDRIRARDYGRFMNRGGGRTRTTTRGGQNRRHDATNANANSGLHHGKRSIDGLAVSIAVFGLIAGIVFAMIFLHAENVSRRNEFESGASVTVAKIIDSFDEYADAASLIHGRCRHRPRFNASAFASDPNTYTEYYNTWSESFRKDFRELYEYIYASGLEFKAMQFDPNITSLERPNAEAEAAAFYSEHYPGVNYTGFRGFNGNYSTTLEPRWRNQTFYFPIHYMEPIQGNEAAIDLDYFSSESRIRAVKATFATQRPSLTDRLSLVKQAGQVSRCSSGNNNNDLLASYSNSGPSFGVVLMHPGVRLSEDDETSWPRDFSSIVLCISDLMKRAAIHQNREVSVYIHDLSHPKETNPVFMGAAKLHCNETNKNKNPHKKALHQSTPNNIIPAFGLLEEVSLDDLSCDNGLSCYQKTVTIANRKWTVTVLNDEGPDQIQLIIVAMIGLLIFVAFVGLAIWVVANDRRNRTYAALKSKAAAERNALVLENANKAAQTERELNDFLAHEVRNPLSAAMAATQFLRTELDRRSKSTRGIGAHFKDDFDDATVDHQHEQDEEVDGHGQQHHHQHQQQQQHAEDGLFSSSLSSQVMLDSSTNSRAALDSSTKSCCRSRLVQAREDIRVVDHALHFINDLLRNMLDMNRADSKKLKVKFAPADLLQDVLEPIAGMLHRGGENIGGGNSNGESKVQIIVDCPENTIVETDVLRLKQVILNLSRNSVKFINEGFIRLRAEVVRRDHDDDGLRFEDYDDNNSGSKFFDIESNTSSTTVDSTVRLYVEDSGSGIPKEKQENLFNKYQESLDLLGQGTGIGLHLCKTLVELMGGEITLDPTYDSGVPGYPGARFVIDLQSSPIGSHMFSPTEDGLRIDENVDKGGDEDIDGDNEYKQVERNERIGTSHGTDENISSVALPELPKHLKVLFVDDDRILRKLFSRTMKTIAPEWTIREAANGETAILVAEEEDFDLIFCDMYMASVEKQLLGTETVAELRANGITSRICGLSANDKEIEFLEAGSDAFLFKPIPCDKKALTRMLQRVLYVEHQNRIL